MPLSKRTPLRPDESSDVLIASADAASAALLGGLVETLGFTVQFAMLDEPPDARLRRARPRVYMIDCETTEDCNDEVIGRAIMRGITVMLFGPRTLLRDMRELAARHQVELLFTPVGPGPLSDALDRAARRSG